MAASINTVAGPISPEQLGRTLMHEHVFVEYGGPSATLCQPGYAFDEAVAACLDFAAQVRACGVASLVDPTTVDLGRNIPLLAEIAARTGLHIICCTGIYNTGTYLRLRAQLGNRPEAVADLFVRELSEGIGQTGVKAGIIKVVTGADEIEDEEQELLLAAAAAAVQTGAPIVTHTEGIGGPEQQRILVKAGVPAHRIIIGHSCLATDFAYHQSILAGGSYLGFDRFGMPGMADEQRADALLRLLKAGYASRLVVSHDSVWHWVGGPRMGAGSCRYWKPTNFFERVIPLLKQGGATEAQVAMLLDENPRRFFAGEPA